MHKLREYLFIIVVVQVREQWKKTVAAMEALRKTG
jgi:hypothetical protein